MLRPCSGWSPRCAVTAPTRAGRRSTSSSAGLNQQETAARLGITRQAVSQRLQTAHWSTEQAAVATLGRLLARADRVASP